MTEQITYTQSDLDYLRSRVEYAEQMNRRLALELAAKTSPQEASTTDVFKVADQFLGYLEGDYEDTDD